MRNQSLTALAHLCVYAHTNVFNVCIFVNGRERVGKDSGETHCDHITPFPGEEIRQLCV